LAFFAASGETEAVLDLAGTAALPAVCGFSDAARCFAGGFADAITFASACFGAGLAAAFFLSSFAGCALAALGSGLLAVLSAAAFVSAGLPADGFGFAAVFAAGFDLSCCLELESCTGCVLPVGAFLVLSEDVGPLAEALSDSLGAVCRLSTGFAFAAAFGIGSFDFVLLVGLASFDLSECVEFVFFCADLAFNSFPVVAVD
jgi:hypothetical protein